MKRYLALLSGLLSFGFMACQNGGNKEFSPALNDSTSYTGATGDSVKLVKSAGLNFRVTNVEKGVRQISSLASDLGGMVYHQDLQSVETERKELPLSRDSFLVITTVSTLANMTVRVPSQNLELFLNDAADLGYFTGSSTLHIDDKSLLYLENVLKQKKPVDITVTENGDQIHCRHRKSNFHPRRSR